MLINEKDLTLDEKIGQMVMIGMDTTNAKEKVTELILKYKIGGVLLYRKNYNNYKELLEFINHIKSVNKKNKIPLFIAIDQEGGRVNRMPNEFENLPSAYQLAKKENIKIIEEAGCITGKMLKNIGINIDFAPVLDIKRFGENHAIGDRAFSEDKECVAKYGGTFMKELQKQKIISVVKHFPGHGATKQDSHINIPTIKMDISNLEKEDMLPFEYVIKNGAEALLISHLKIKNFAEKGPITMSKKFILKYIRKRYNFDGLIITDDMRMRSMVLTYGVNQPIRKAFKAGNDIIVFKYRPNEKIFGQIKTNINKGDIDISQINESVNRIIKIKQKYQLNNEEVKINKEFIKEVNSRILQLKNL